MQESHLKSQLLQHLPRQQKAFGVIEEKFDQLTSKRHEKDLLRNFFHSWSQTNNSAVTVAGIGNRLTMLVHKERPVGDKLQLLLSLTSLNRIVDEDLAVVGRLLHSDLFYTMATSVCTDDGWLSKKYLHKTAEDFKAWKDQNSLREKDLMIALLTTLIHEIYTHGEVEFILPKFRKWLIEEYGFAKAYCDKTLAWISVHCGPTEKNHFFYALGAIFHYCGAMNVRLEDYDLKEIIETYLSKKALVMQAVVCGKVLLVN
jgi:hypothetical protein